MIRLIQTILLLRVKLVQNKSNCLKKKLKTNPILPLILGLAVRIFLGAMSKFSPKIPSKQYQKNYKTIMNIC